uniref:Uncharacterized protein n=1 Tax=Desulfovibrio sp. U5L TaxID=596152 RepID=I2Q2Q0_9BACT
MEQTMKNCIIIETGYADGPYNIATPTPDKDGFDRSVLVRGEKNYMTKADALRAAHNVGYTHESGKRIPARYRD